MPYPCLSTLFLSPPYTLLSNSWYQQSIQGRYTAPISHSSIMSVYLITALLLWWKRSQCSAIHKLSHVVERSSVVNERHINFSFSDSQSLTVKLSHCHNNKHSTAGSHSAKVCYYLLLTCLASFLSRPWQTEVSFNRAIPPWCYGGCF